jgi:hypothetical protein
VRSSPTASDVARRRAPIGSLGNSIHGAPVISPDASARLPRRPIVASVAGETPRARIRAALHAMGLRELHDFVCAA